jgi:hypothetical protein
MTAEPVLAGARWRLDPEVVQVVQPYQARKRYTCPGCLGSILPGTGHLVVVPEWDPELRRHWHRGCWFKEQRRRGIHRD